MGTSIEHYCMTRHRRASALWTAGIGGLLVAAVGAAAAAWPSFLPPASHFTERVVDDVEGTFGAATLTRTVHGEPAPVPLHDYLAFVDAPDLTAAAARHLGLARYEVHMLGPDVYQADDRDGNRGSYRVLARDDGRRVILSRGSHSGWIIGTIRGRALSILDFEANGEQTSQTITAWVRIDNAAAAALARTLAPLFGGLMDRKLAEGFRVTSRVAEWALGHPAEFCDWLEHEPALADRRADLPAGLPTCTTASAGQPAGPRTP
jgi:hypothetical protein